MWVSRSSIQWVVSVVGVAIIATACGGNSIRPNEDGDEANGAGSSEAGETARGGSGGTSRAPSGGVSGRGGSGVGGGAIGGTDAGEGGSSGGPRGGSAGTTSTGGAAGVGGTGGNVAGAGGSAGAPGGTGGTAAMGPYACDMPKAANCGVISDFSNVTAQTWGSGDFSGGVSVFGDIRRDAATVTSLHVTGEVAGFGRGFVVWLTWCSTLTAYAGITFTLSGTTTDAVDPNTMDFAIQTNSNYPWQPFVATNTEKGACTVGDVLDVWSMCIAASTSVVLSASPTFVPWAQLSGGMPVAWNASLSPAEIVGLQWQFPWSEGRERYQIDVTLDDVTFTGGVGPTTVCPPYVQ